MTTERIATEKKATFVKQMGSVGDGRLYRIDPPMTVGLGDSEATTEYVWVSAVVVPYSGPETYIFASDADGKVTSWSELDGSYRGGLDHAEALRGAGYSVQD